MGYELEAYTAANSDPALPTNGVVVTGQRGARL
jgi:hypothetical protein